MVDTENPSCAISENVCTRRWQLHMTQNAHLATSTHGGLDRCLDVCTRWRLCGGHEVAAKGYSFRRLSAFFMSATSAAQVSVTCSQTIWCSAERRIWCSAELPAVHCVLHAPTCIP